MKSSPFQIILTATFAVFILVAFVALYFSKANSPSNQAKVEISLWGSAPSAYIQAVLGAIQPEKSGLSVTYREISADQFDQTLLEAMAGGQGPDAIIISQDSIVKNNNKILPIPYKSLTERTFKDTYVTGAELFLGGSGVVAVPFAIDPLIMYWNRDIFSNAGLAVAPRYWDEFLRLAETLTVKNGSVTIQKSVVPLGGFSNVNNAKEIISAMTLQTGTPITMYPSNGGSLTVALNSSDNNGGLQNVVDFYTEFANPVKSVYTWNRSLPHSLIMFTQGALATYFGFGSEIPSIKNKNPNLDFDISYFPQPRSANINITFGKILAVGAMRGSAKASSAMQLALLMGSAVGVKAWDDASGLPPVRRDLLSAVPSDSYGAVLYNSALWSRGWFDPEPARTKGFMSDMIEAVTSGWMTTSEAVNKFSSQMNLLLSGR